MFCEKGLGPATLLKKRLWHRCFPVNFLKFLRTPFLANPTKKKLMTKCPFTKKHNTRLQHRCIYIQRKYTEMNAINIIRLVSQHERQYKKGQSHRSIKFQNTIVVYITVTIYYFLMFFISCCFWISGFSYHFFLQIFPATPIRSSKVYFIFLISVFAIFSINNLNVCHRNFDVNRNHYNYTTFTIKILNINRIRYNCGEMAEITYPNFDQPYSKYIFRNSISHNLQRAEGNWDKLKVIIIISSFWCILPFHIMRSVFHLIETTHHQQNEMQKQSSILENGITSARWY